jgi:hypothetical protein
MRCAETSLEGTLAHLVEIVGGAAPVAQEHEGRVGEER